MIEGQCISVSVRYQIKREALYEASDELESYGLLDSMIIIKAMIDELDNAHHVWAASTVKKGDE